MNNGLLKGFVKGVMAVALAVVTQLGFAGNPKYQSKMTVAGYSGASELEDFPVLVRISPALIVK